MGVTGIVLPGPSLGNTNPVFLDNVRSTGSNYSGVGSGCCICRGNPTLGRGAAMHGANG